MGEWSCRYNKYCKCGICVYLEYNEIRDLILFIKEMSESRGNRDAKYRNNVGLAILFVLVFVFGIIVGRNIQGSNQISILSGGKANLDTFWQVWDVVSKNYVDRDKVDKDKMVLGAIKGMVNSYDDPATVYLDPEETKDFEKASSGQSFEGIGAELGYENGNVIVVTPLDGSPAKEAGIRARDYILKVDDYELKSTDSVYDAVAKIRGKSGTKVKLTVLHRGERNPVEIEIERKEITVASMTLEFVGEDKKIAHLKISRFTEATLQKWESEWDAKIKEIVDSGVEKLILDLRGNPGGFFDAAIYAGDDFLSEGKIISQQKDASGKIEKFISKKGGKMLNIKLVVLVNEGSASASEILAGALQQNGRAEIVGAKTYGKGTAQRIYPLPDASSLHLTVLRWLLPDGQNIDRENSIKPNVEVELTDEDFRAGKDPQKDKAIEMLSK